MREIPNEVPAAMGPPSEVTAQYFTPEPFNRAHPEFLETRKDNNKDCCFKLEFFEWDRSDLFYSNGD